MELRALHYFVTVAEELHFGRAAERLRIVQPAVSQQIARLERELGVRLLDRSPRSVRLTDAGRRVLVAARDALSAAEQVRVAAGEPSGEWRIGTAAGLTGRLERGIDAVRERNPSFEVILVDLPVTERLDAVRRGELDLALVRGTVAAPGLRVLPAWSEPLHAVVSARHTAADGEAVTLEDLSADVLRLPDRRSDLPLYDAVIEALQNAGVSPPLGRPTGTTQDTVVEVGSDPHSWALLPADQIAGLGTNRVRALPLKPDLSVTGYVLTPDDDASEPCVDFVASVFRDPVRSAD